MTSNVLPLWRGIFFFFVLNLFPTDSIVAGIFCERVICFARFWTMSALCDCKIYCSKFSLNCGFKVPKNVLTFWKHNLLYHLQSHTIMSDGSFVVVHPCMFLMQMIFWICNLQIMSPKAVFLLSNWFTWAQTKQIWIHKKCIPGEAGQL